MDANLITALAGVLGSVSGASAAIATTWISQKSQTVRERAKWETRKRETLYGDFITEASHLVADAFDHSLDKPETLVKLYAHLGRIRLVSSDPVLAAAEECCERIVDLYRAAEQNDRRDLRGHAQQGVGILQSVQRGLPRRASPVFRLLNRYSRCKALWLCQRGKIRARFNQRLSANFRGVLPQFLQKPQQCQPLIF